jgi:hypothetical protein
MPAQRCPQPNITDPFVNLTPASPSVHTHPFTYDVLLPHPDDPPCLGPRNQALIPNLRTFMSNEAVTTSDIVWRRPEDYADQTPTLIALTTIHYHFCPFTCHEGHDEEHTLLLYLWDYRDWFRRQYRPPFTTTARNRTVAAFRGRSIIPPNAFPEPESTPRFSFTFVMDSWVAPTTTRSPFTRYPRPIVPRPTNEEPTDEVGTTSHLTRG